MELFFHAFGFIIVVTYFSLIAASSLPFPLNDAVNCSYRKADVVFILDESTSIWESSWKEQIRFVQRLANAFDISPVLTRVGLITYSSYAIQRFEIGRYGKKKELIEAIGRITSRGGNTNTAGALELARTHTFRTRNGARGKNVTRIAIVVTDGRSQMPKNTLEQAAKMKKEDIILVAIGVGRQISGTELEGIATERSNIFRVDSYSRLRSIERELKEKTCLDDENEIKLSGGDSDQEEWNLPQKDEAKCVPGAPTDLMFVLDTSKSIWPEDHQKMLLFVEELVHSFRIGAQNTRVGAVAFSTYPKQAFYLNSYTNLQDLIAAISKIPKLNSGTDTASALRFVRTVSYSEENGGRKDASKVAIVITDGISRDSSETLGEADAAKAAGIKIFIIGVGKRIDLKELHGMASSPSFKHVLRADSFNALSSLKKELVVGTCAELNDQPFQIMACPNDTMADVAFVIDYQRTHRIGIQLTLDSIKEVTHSLYMGPGGVKVSLLSRMCPHVNEFGLNDNRDDVEKGIFSHPRRDLTEILKDLRTSTFTTGKGSRPTSTKVAVIYTDGLPTNEAEAAYEAATLKSAGVKIVVVGVGRRVSETFLEKIASNPWKSKTMIVIQSASHIRDSQDVILNTVC